MHYRGQDGACAHNTSLRLRLPAHQQMTIRLRLLIICLANLLRASPETPC